ncbi:MAG TPA: hypothetical protein VF950_21490 [Planctomycetota bacterium]
MALFGKTLTVHVRYDGKSYDLTLEDLMLKANMSDDDVREALARHFDVSPREFRPYVVERHRTGNLTVRPEAVFG